MLEIQTIHIRYFRSIYNEKIKVGDINTFVGLNDAGKSNVLKALNLFFNGDTGWREPFNFSTDFNKDRQSKFDAPKPPKESKEIVITLIFRKVNDAVPVWTKKWKSDGSFSELQSDRATPKVERNNDTGFRPRSRIPSMLQKIKYYYVPALKGPEYISFLVGRFSEIISEKARNDILGAANGFEDRLSGYLQDITGDIKNILEIQSLLKLPKNLVKIFENMEFSDENGIALSHRGDGIRTRHIPILLEKISTLHAELKEKGELYDRFIWGYEEPENNVELLACFDMADQFWEASEYHQIFITTHSPAFYGLSERKCTGWTQGEEEAYRYQVINFEGKSIFKETSLDQLDPHFLLPSATRLIEDERQRHKEMEARYTELQAEIEAENNPTIILEGPSDFHIFNKVLEIFAPEHLDLVRFKYPEGGLNGGGVNFIKDHLIAWEHIQLHQPEKDCVSAIGLFDKDEAGIAACKKYREVVQNCRCAFATYYFVPSVAGNQFGDLRLGDLQINLPVCLENIYTPEFWDIADNNGWLIEAINKLKFASETAKDRLASTEDTIETLVPNIELRRYVTHRFNSLRKVEAAQYIAGLKNDRARPYLTHFEPILLDALKRLGIEDGDGAE